MAKAAPKYLAREMSMSEAVSEAMSELQTLAEEMREAFDNTPESLQGGGVGEARGEAADNLENLSEPDVPTSLEAIKVAWSVRELSPSKLRKQSRSDRRNDALETAKLEEIKDDEASSEELAGDAETLRDEIENLMSDAENVEFPGMYG